MARWAPTSGSLSYGRELQLKIARLCKRQKAMARWTLTSGGLRLRRPPATQQPLRQALTAQGEARRPRSPQWA